MRAPVSPAGAQLDAAKLAFALSLLLLPFGWGIRWTYRQRSLDAVAAHGWPRAPGVVTESSVVHGSSSKSESSPVVRYEFRVDGETYRGEDVSLDVATATSENARDVVARYPVGREVEVYYDPARPAEASALEQTELDFWDDLLLGLGTFSRWSGALCLLLAVLQLWKSERTTRSWRPEQANAGSSSGSERR